MKPRSTIAFSEIRVVAPAGISAIARPFIDTHQQLMRWVLAAIVAFVFIGIIHSIRKCSRQRGPVMSSRLRFRREQMCFSCTGTELSLGFLFLAGAMFA